MKYAIQANSITIHESRECVRATKKAEILKGIRDEFFNNLKKSRENLDEKVIKSYGSLMTGAEYLRHRSRSCGIDLLTAEITAVEIETIKIITFEEFEKQLEEHGI